MYGDLGAAVDEWRKERNAIVHGIVKSNPGEPTQNIQSFLARAERAANEGKSLARAVSDWHQGELRRAQK